MRFNSLALVSALILLVIFSSGCTLQPETSQGQATPPSGESSESPTPHPSPTVQPTEFNASGQAEPTPEPEATSQEQAAAGPNGCTSTEECTAFCLNNQPECSQFCGLNPTNEFCQVQQDAPPQGNELPCSTQEECDVYCSQNPSACGSQETESVEVSLPFDPEYYSPRDWGLWPFCVHGGDHPEGHGGIDFELDGEAQILAACDGTVEFIETTESGAEHGEGLMLSCGNFVASYHGLTNIRAQTGDTLKKGDYIADPVKIENEYYIHFEINDFINEKLVCPLSYIDSEFRAELDKMHSKSKYPEKSSEPELCNCDWLPYKESMKGGP